MILEFPKCDDLKVNVEENQEIMRQKNVKDIISKQSFLLKNSYIKQG